MILLLLKVTVLLALALGLSAAMRRSSAALRCLICVCGLAGCLLLLGTLAAPAGPEVFRFAVLSGTGTSRAVRGAGGMRFGWVVWVWAAGTGVLLVRLGFGYWRLARLRRGGSGVVYADVSVPLVAGLLRPAILLPMAAEEWPAERLEAALRHEREHLRRGDLWTLLLSHLACAVYWFHPLVWMVAGRLRAEQEHACDDAVILSGFSTAGYAEALVAAARHLTSADLMGCPMVSQKTFRSRIARLLTDGMPRASSYGSLWRAAVVFAAAVITIGMVSGKPRAQEPGQNGEVFRVGHGVRQPRVISRVEPEYSVGAQAAKVEGTVLLSVVIGTDGLAHNINVVKKLGSGLDEKAVEAVQKWRFEPGMKGGTAVRTRAQIEVNYRLK